MKTYRVGLLIDGTDQPGWIHDMAEWLARSQDFDLSALLLCQVDMACGTGTAIGLARRIHGATLSSPRCDTAAFRCDLPDGFHPRTHVRGQTAQRHLDDAMRVASANSRVSHAKERAPRQLSF